MINAILCLMGPGGVGKLTIGRLVAERLGCRLVDNHYWLNPIFGLIEQDGVTPLPKIVWPLVEQVREAVFKTIATVSPPDWGFVFTHQVTAADNDRTLTDAIASLAAHRKAHLLGVRLICGPEELVRRVTHPERRLQMKDADPDAARAKAVMPPFDPGWPNLLTIDTTGISAEQSAGLLVRHVKEVFPSPWAAHSDLHTDG